MTTSYATDVSPIFVDLESAPLKNVRDYLEPPDLTDIHAPINYVKAEAIEGYIEREKAKRLADFETDCTNAAALDFNTARIVCLGLWTAAEGADTWTCVNEEREAWMLHEFWHAAQNRLIVGFSIREFDLPMIIQRSRYLGVTHRTPDLGRYAKGSGILDLRDLLTFNDMRYANLMPRTLKAFAKRFGLPVTDDIDGKDVPALAAAGDWEAIAKHCTADLELTVALARRLGVVQPVAEPAAVI